MRGIVFLLFLSLFAAAFAAAAYADRRQEERQAAQEAVSEADRLLNGGDIERAAVRIGELLASHENDPVYGWQLTERYGVALLRAGRTAEALPVCESVVRRNPESAAGHRNLAAVLMQLGRRGRALSEYDQAVQLAPRDSALRFEYGQVLLGFRNYAAAGAQLEAARSLCGDCPELRPALAHLYVETGRYEQAIPLQAALYAENPDRDNRRNLVRSLQHAGRDSQLVALWSPIPGDELPADEARMLVEAEGRLGGFVHSLRYARSMAAAKSEPDSLPRDAAFWGAISLNLLDTGHLVEGLRAADRAVMLAPGDAVYRNNRVVLLTRLGRQEEAEREWKKVLELDPTLKRQEKR